MDRTDPRRSFTTTRRTKLPNSARNSCCHAQRTQQGFLIYQALWTALRIEALQTREYDIVVRIKLQSRELVEVGWRKNSTHRANNHGLRTKYQSRGVLLSYALHYLMDDIACGGFLRKHSQARTKVVVKYFLHSADIFYSCSMARHVLAHLRS